MNTTKYHSSTPSDSKGDLSDPIPTGDTAPAPETTAEAPQDSSSARPTSSTALSLVLLETGLIRTGSEFNRQADALDTPEFEGLVTSILQTKGNTQAIVVTPLPESEVSDGQRQRYLLVSGHRRWAACEMLGFKVLAMIRNDPASGDPLLDRLIENHHRQNLSPIEFGRQVDKLMSQRRDLSARRIGKALGCDHSLILKARDVAQLPPEVIACFGNAADIRYKDADQLKSAFKQAPDAVINEAKAVAGETASLSASQVVQRLTQAASKFQKEKGVAEDVGGERFTTPAEVPLQINGQEVGTVRHDKKGNLTFTVFVPLTPPQQATLTKAIEAFIRRRVLRIAPTKPQGAGQDKAPASAKGTASAAEAKKAA